MQPRRKTFLFAAAMLMPLAAVGVPLLIVSALRHFAPYFPVKAWPGEQAVNDHSHSVGIAVPSFSLLDQENRPVTLESLNGEVWIASFFFTRCAGTCPMTSAKMARLQREIGDRNVRLVSFSMDPAYDTPAVLRDYAKQFDVDGERWHMLTGERQQITAVIERLGLADPTQGQKAETLIHSDKFVLIDQHGRTRGYFTGTDDMALKHLAADAELLSRGRGN